MFYKQKRLNKFNFQKGISSILAIIGALVGIGVVVASFTFISDGSDSQPRSLKELIPFSSPKATPFPFEDLTVPFLKNREFESSLRELERISQHPDYTAYLTSYDSDGLKINGLLTIPRNEEPEEGFPAIVFVHGYIPPTIYTTTSNYSAYVDYLARNGFVVFKIDLRGHANSEGEPGGAYYSGDYIVDTLNARAALQSSSFVNGEKIGLWGHSMGGNVVFRSFVAKNIPAAVIWAGAVYTYEDMSEFGINDNSYRPPSEDTERRRKREELRQTWGDFDPGSDFWQMVVPTNYLDGIDGALQIHHAVNDSVVDIGYSRNLMDILDNTLITHELVEYTSGGHNIEGSSFNQAIEETVNFFKEHLN